MHCPRLARPTRRALLLLATLLAPAMAPTSTSPSLAAGALQVLAVPGGQPDDIAVDTSGRLVWGNLARGTIERLQGGRVFTIARGLSVPEGVIPRRHDLVVAEQGLDRVVSLHGRKVQVLVALVPVSGQEGVDGIGRDPRTGDLLIPDSPRGTVIRTAANGLRSSIIARNLGRPVDAAVDRRGDVLVPDEHLGTLVVIPPRGRIRYRGSFSTPDDVAVSSNGVIWVTSLGDGGLWRLTNAGTTRVLGGLANPQGLTLDRCGDPIIVEQNTARIVRLLLTGRSAHCPY
ncbi:MAG TPA: hypothetical protein VFB58_00265 [Chloroflexota bacterium]|nr:hypothetical protein [Chloroflexota bacterium]